MTLLWKSCRRIAIAGAVVSCMAASIVAGASDVAVLTVRTVNDRTLVGEIDTRTDGRQLWIRRQSEHIVLATPVEWSSITSAHLNGAPIEVPALAEAASQLASPGPVAFLAEKIVGDEHRSELATASWNAELNGPRDWRPTRRRIGNIEIDAYLVNLDRDVEPDGVEVVVAAIDVHGHSAAVRGSLSARLTVERSDYHTGRTQFETAQRWTRPVAVVDFVDGAASYRLPFRTVRPERDLELQSLGLLNVRLGVAGQGNFEASVPLSIRPLNPVRDSLQLLEGSRILRDELAEPVRRRPISRFGGGARVWTPYSVIGVSH
ncbi:hypothetical protein OAS39_06015 [Pirellulales bacterium]|nr:hypothetical protein [Pirellulales bacterium]